ncbi:hypothetical protein ACH5RR_038894 [Cinchona calisaya]|uniref:Disease resistance protein At4g27190-like leucine-rich repeats domain-containing protein n=1 Tax=Cinchona calisaya TaxID=153742 RepID=A0ABD2XYE5_9GENT
MFQKIVMNSGSVGIFDSLSILNIEDSGSSFQLAEGYNAQQFDLLPNLETLYLRHLTMLTSISELAELLGLKLARLRKIKIENCPRLKYLLSLGSSFQGLEQLTEISLELCEELEELFRNDSTNSPSQTLVSNLAFPKFELMSLKSLPKLQTFCRQSPITCPVISKIEVIDCHLLTKLPVTIQNADTIKEIHGQRRWWRKLEWDNGEIKSSLEHIFVPV